MANSIERAPDAVRAADTRAAQWQRAFSGLGQIVLGIRFLGLALWGWLLLEIPIRAGFAHVPRALVVFWLAWLSLPLASRWAVRLARDRWAQGMCAASAVALLVCWALRVEGLKVQLAAVGGLLALLAARGVRRAFSAFGDYGALARDPYDWAGDRIRRYYEARTGYAEPRPAGAGPIYEQDEVLPDRSELNQAMKWVRWTVLVPFAMVCAGAFAVSMLSWARTSVQGPEQYLAIRHILAIWLLAIALMVFFIGTIAMDVRSGAAAGGVSPGWFLPALVFPLVFWPHFVLLCAAIHVLTGRRLRRYLGSPPGFYGRQARRLWGRRLWGRTGSGTKRAIRGAFGWGALILASWILLSGRSPVFNDAATTLESFWWVPAALCGLLLISAGIANHRLYLRLRRETAR